MKKLIYLIVLASILGLVLAGCSLLSNIGQVPSTNQSGMTYLTKGGPTEAEAESFPLYAGQDWLVGEVLVWDNGETLCVKYQLNEDALAEGWLLYETHLAIAADLSGIPRNKAGNPKVGNFPYGNDELGGVAEDGPYCIPIGDGEGELDVECGDKLVIAAHAVIEKTECVLTVQAPYSASSILDYEQGLQINGSAVKSERSVPENALFYETGQKEDNFFSLGFGGWMILEFGCHITNGEGNDVRVVEDTWGTYPLEKANVYASQDNISWTLLGEADNVSRNTGDNIHTFFEFDLGDLEWATYIKVEDTTDKTIWEIRPTADGYDLNAVLALHDCEVCTTYKETAWAADAEIDGDEEGTIQFVADGKSWATYFEYTVECCWE